MLNLKLHTFAKRSFRSEKLKRDIMKRNFFTLSFLLFGLLFIHVYSAFGNWQYVESEGETTTSSTSYQTKVKLVSDSTGYHLIILSWEIGNTSTRRYAQARVTLNDSVTSEFGAGLGGR